MATEALPILNLSPIPELSEMELSAVLEQLSSVSDPNGEVTDRNVEDIIRAAEELIDMSDSFKVDVSDRNNFKHNDGNIHTKPVEICNEEKCDDKDRKGVKFCDSESANDTLNISLSSEDISQKNSKSESLKSKKNETSPSLTELHSSVSPRSMTNHIQSTLNSLREYSEKIKQSKISSVSSDEAFDVCSSLEDEKSKLSSSNTEEQCSKDLKLMKERPCYNVENEKHLHEKQMTDTRNIKPSLKLIERNKGPSKPIQGLSLDKSLKTLDCFERLYREKFVKDKNDIKKLKAPGRIYNSKQVSCVKAGKRIKSNKIEVSCKDLKSKNVKQGLQNSLQQSKARVSVVKEDIIDEDINIQECLNLLQQESEDQNGGSNAISNYIDFTEKMLKQCTESISLLQGEVDDLKCQLKKTAVKEHSVNRVQCPPVKSLSRKEEINNVKHLKEINDSKGRTEEVEGTGCDRNECRKSSVEMEAVEKLRAEVGNLKQSMIMAYTENNGISKLEKQFSLLKVKYDQQIGKLEDENKKLKEIISGETGGPLSRRSDRSERGVQTEKIGASSTEEDVIEPGRKNLIRSLSLDNCWTILRAPSSRSRSLETVDACTSPVRLPRELCSVSVQCRGESEPGEPPRRGYVKELKELTKMENKENLTRGKATSICGYRGGNYLKQKKFSERENELMVTVRALNQEITAKDRDIKKMRNESELLRNQIKRLGGEVAKYKSEKKFCHFGTQTIGLVLKMREDYDPTMFQVSRELEEENDGLKARVNELEKMINQLNDKRVNDLKILQKLHEEEIDKLASRLNTQTALTNHLHSLLSNR